MHISQINIKNFRLFNDFSLTLNQGMNLLIGENNAGKTALIDAIKLVLDTNSTEWVRVQEDDFCFHSNKDELSIQLKFENLNSPDLGAFAEHLTLEEADKGEETKNTLYINLLANKQEDKRYYRGVRIYTQFRSGKDADGPIIDPKTRDYLSTTYLKPLRDAKAELSAGQNSRLSQLLTSAKSLGNNEETIKKLIELILKYNEEINTNLEIKETEEKISKNLKELTFTADQQLFDPTLNIFSYDEYEKMTSPQRKEAFRHIMEKLTLELNRNNQQHGLGYSNLLFMAAEMLFLNEQDVGFRSLLIEEPEAHLHPQLQLKFMQFIQSLDNIQCFLSTHSPNLASKAPLESIILMHKGEGFSLRKGNTELADDDYQFLEKFLDVTKANMFFARGILMVEGDAENILLPTIAKLLGYPLEDHGISIINIGNLAYKRYAKIYRSINEENTPPPIKVACITDCDLWPDKAEKSPDNSVGFKERKEGNKQYWESEYQTSEEREKRLAIKKEADGGNVKTFISDKWTFEYCLAYYGLADELIEAINKDRTNIKPSELSEDKEKKAIQIYKHIETTQSGKTRYTYHLATILKDKYTERKEELKKKIPPYIREALEYLFEEKKEGHND